MARMVKCPECGEIFKSPLFKEKRHGLGFNFPGMPGALTCPKCKYRANDSEFPRADDQSSSPK
jgi:ssDNA-binding Zn-finger/Zn-ribbon topoisomerase 1